MIAVYSSGGSDGDITEYTFVKVQKCTIDGQYGVYVVTGPAPETQWQGPALAVGPYDKALEKGLEKIRALREVIDNERLEFIVRHDLAAPFDIDA